MFKLFLLHFNMFLFAIIAALIAANEGACPPMLGVNISECTDSLCSYICPGDQSFLNMKFSMCEFNIWIPPPQDNCFGLLSGRTSSANCNLTVANGQILPLCLKCGTLGQPCCLLKTAVSCRSGYSLSQTFPSDVANLFLLCSADGSWNIDSSNWDQLCVLASSQQQTAASRAPSTTRVAWSSASDTTDVAGPLPSVPWTLEPGHPCPIPSSWKQTAELTCLFAVADPLSFEALPHSSICTLTCRDGFVSQSSLITIGLSLRCTNTRWVPILTLTTDSQLVQLPCRRACPAVNMVPCAASIDQCYLLEQSCDGHRDCLDGSDEVVCDKNRQIWHNLLEMPSAPPTTWIVLPVVVVLCLIVVLGIVWWHHVRRGRRLPCRACRHRSTRRSGDRRWRRSRCRSAGMVPDAPALSSIPASAVLFSYSQTPPDDHECPTYRSSAGECGPPSYATVTLSLPTYEEAIKAKPAESKRAERAKEAAGSTVRAPGGAAARPSGGQSRSSIGGEQCALPPKGSPPVSAANRSPPAPPASPGPPAQTCAPPASASASALPPPPPPS